MPPTNPTSPENPTHLSAQTILPINRINAIALGVRDLPRARAFYETLGWDLEFANDIVAMYAILGGKFGLYDVTRLAMDLDVEPDSLGFGAMSLAQNYPSKTDVDTAYHTAIKAGASPRTPPKDMFWGGYSGHVADPEGHIWEYCYNPFWTLDKDGHIVPPAPTTK